MKIELFGHEVELQELGNDPSGQKARYQTMFRGVMFRLEVGAKSSRISAHVVHGSWIEHDDRTPQAAADRFAAEIRTLKTRLELLTAPRVNPG